MSVAYNSRIVTDGLILYLDARNTKSYPGSGDIWYDLSGNKYNATRTNTAGYGGPVTYDSSGFFDFTVNNPASTVGALAGNGFTMATSIIPSTGSFTLTAFIRRSTALRAKGDRETIFSNTQNLDGYRFGVHPTNGQIYYAIGGLIGGVSVYRNEGAIGTGPTNILYDGNWHMITVVFDRAAQLGTYDVHAYYNGVFSQSIAITGGADANTAWEPVNGTTTTNPGIGIRGCCDVFAGHLGVLMAHSKALTASEVQQNFNALRGRYSI